MAAPGQVMAALMNQQLQRTINPAWMPDPDSWVWAPAEGHPPSQGWGRTWRGNPGLANLLWLVMNQDTVPKVWNARAHGEYTGLMAGAGHMFKGLIELAEVNSLPDFAVKLRGRRQLADVGYIGFAEKLLQLADRRMHAKP